MTREEAIKILENMPIPSMDGYSFNDISDALYIAVDALQTDIVHCEECEWWQKQDDSLQGRCAKYGFYPTGRYFCAGGERKE